MKTLYINFDNLGNVHKQKNIFGRGLDGAEVIERIEITELYEGHFAARWFCNNIISKTALFSWKGAGHEPDLIRYSYTICKEEMPETLDKKILSNICKQILIHEILNG